ncbi:hypothetical protein TWF718_000710 [Orbilia javanica]|uniref:Uncharacterized protein n=1 Tax=Orbilia javanica TaxID=47235 RepID=A0AAN8NCQ5_9PEZI
MVFKERNYRLKKLNNGSWRVSSGYDSDCYEVSKSDHHKSCNKPRDSDCSKRSSSSENCYIHRHQISLDEVSPLKSSNHTEESACGACRGTGHDRRNCPRLIKVSSDGDQKVVTEALQTLQGFISNIINTAKTKKSPKKQTIKKPAIPATKQPTLSEKDKAPESHRWKGKDNKARSVRITRKSSHAPIGVVKNKSKTRTVPRHFDFTLNVD